MSKATYWKRSNRKCETQVTFYAPWAVGFFWERARCRSYLEKSSLTLYKSHGLFSLNISCHVCRIKDEQNFWHSDLIFCSSLTHQHFLICRSFLETSHTFYGICYHSAKGIISVSALNIPYWMLWALKKNLIMKHDSKLWKIYHVIMIIAMLVVLHIEEIILFPQELSWHLLS